MAPLNHVVSDLGRFFRVSICALEATTYSADKPFLLYRIGEV